MRKLNAEDRDRKIIVPNKERPKRKDLCLHRYFYSFFFFLNVLYSINHNKNDASVTQNWKKGLAELFFAFDGLQEKKNCRNFCAF
jgi:hypothetical protein